MYSCQLLITWQQKGLHTRWFIMLSHSYRCTKYIFFIQYGCIQYTVNACVLHQPGNMVNFAALMRDHCMNICVPLGFVIGIYMDSAQDQKLTAFRNKSALYSRWVKSAPTDTQFLSKPCCAGADILFSQTMADSRPGQPCTSRSCGLNQASVSSLHMKLYIPSNSPSVY